MGCSRRLRESRVPAQTGAGGEWEVGDQSQPSEQKNRHSKCTGVHAAQSA
jgi:hypothetical protein